MALDTLSLARPYAKAAFQQALTDQQLESWQQALQVLQIITADPNVQAVIQDPRVAPDQLANFILSVGQAHFIPPVQNFIRLLAEKKRLALANDIQQLFEHYVADYHQSVDVQVISFTSLSETQKTKLTEALIQRLQRKVAIDFCEDSQLLGGAVVRAGNWVLDGSLRHKLDTLKTQLVA
ncbi:MAG: F0F1 ATP synthase subunit delta [Legionellales bacterium]|nr:F0F1 ATP synthase subunit delta [Legionellales bacterium]